MKKFLKYFICASMLVAGGASAALGLHALNSKAVNEAEAAATDVGFDVIETSALYFHQSGSDLNSIMASSMTTVGSANYFENSVCNGSHNEGGQVSFTTINTKTFDVYYMPIRLYVTTPAYKSMIFKSITISMSMQKIADGGAAPAIAQLFYLEDLSAPTSFNTANNDTKDSNAIIRLRTTSCNSMVNGSFTICTTAIKKTNNNNSAQNLCLDLGLMVVGCYGSSYYNAVNVSFNATASQNSYVDNTFWASNGGSQTISTSTWSDALEVYNNTSSSNNSTLLLLDDFTTSSNVTNYTTFSKSGTFDLNGHTFSRENATVTIGVVGNANLTITNGTISGGSNTGISVASSSTLTVNSNVTVTSFGGRGLTNSGTTTFKGTMNGGSGINYIDNTGTLTLSNATISSNVSTSSNGIIVNSGNLYVSGTTSISCASNSKMIHTTSTGKTYLYGSSTIARIGASRGAEIYLYYGSTRYTGNTISLTYNEALSAGDAVAYCYNSSDTSKINLTNNLATYYQLSYTSANKKYSVEYKNFSIIVNMAAGTGSYQLSQSTATYASTVTITLSLAAGYEMGTTSLSYSNCYISRSGNVLTVTNISADVTIGINPTKITFSFHYNGNGNTGVRYDGADGYGFSIARSVNYGDEIEVLKNPYVKTDYTFVGWNTKADGTGTPYAVGDTFVITEDTVLYAQWSNNIDETLVAFITNYMHMDDYTGDGTGLCKNHGNVEGYYIIAKRELMTYSANTITAFRTESAYAAAKERYETWAAFNGDTGWEYQNVYVHINSSNNTIVINNNTMVMAIVTISSILLISAVGFMFVLKRKKHE